LCTKFTKFCGKVGHPSQFKNSSPLSTACFVSNLSCNVAIKPPKIGSFGPTFRREETPKLWPSIFKFDSLPKMWESSAEFHSVTSEGGAQTRKERQNKGKGKRGFVQRLIVNTPLRRSGMAHVLKGSHSFTCTPSVHPLTHNAMPAMTTSDIKIHQIHKTQTTGMPNIMLQATE